MTEEQAFEVAKTVTQFEYPDTDTDSFYLVESELDEEGDWCLLVGYLRLWDSEDIGSEVGKELGLTKDDIGEPSGHWQSQVIVYPLTGDGMLTTHDNLDISEHPDYATTTEQEWRKWAIGNRENKDD